MSTRRTLALPAAAMILLATVSGCSPSSPGLGLGPRAGGTAGFDSLIASIPEARAPLYENYDGSDWNGRGPVSPSVTLSSVGSERLTTIVTRIGTFLASQRGASVKFDEVDLELDSATLRLLDRRDVNDEIRATYAALSLDPHVTGASIGQYTWIEVHTMDGSQLAAEFSSMQRELTGSAEVGSHGIEVQSDDDAASFSITASSATDRPEAAMRAVQKLSGSFHVTGFDISDYSADLTVPANEVARAQKAADALASAAQIDISVGAASGSGADS